MLVEDTMTREVVTVHPLAPIQQVAAEMYERRIGCLPAVGGSNLVWIISASDVMRALVLLLGAHKPGSPVEVEMPDRPESLAEVTGIIRNSNANVDSILTPPGNSAEKIGLIF